MKRIRTVPFLLFFYSSLWAGLADVSPGKSGASFMRVPVSARQKALAGSGFALTGIDFAEENPASVMGAEGALQFSRVMYFEGLALNNARFLFNFESYNPYDGVNKENFLCLGIRSFSFSDDKTDMLTGAKTGNFAVNDKSIYLTYGFTAGGAQAGITVKMISENIDNNSSSAKAFDLGFITGGGEYFSIASSVRNIGGKISGSPLPLTVSLGAAVKGEFVTFTAGAEKTREESLILSVGGEDEINNLTLRLGAKYQSVVEPSAGFGIKWHSFSFDYAVSYHKYLGGNHLFTVQIKL